MSFHQWQTLIREKMERVPNKPPADARHTYSSILATYITTFLAEGNDTFSTFMWHVANLTNSRPDDAIDLAFIQSATAYIVNDLSVLEPHSDVFIQVNTPLSSLLNQSPFIVLALTQRTDTIGFICIALLAICNAIKYPPGRDTLPSPMYPAKAGHGLYNTTVDVDRFVRHITECILPALYAPQFLPPDITPSTAHPPIISMWQFLFSYSNVFHFLTRANGHISVSRVVHQHSLAAYVNFLFETKTTPGDVVQAIYVANVGRDPFQNHLRAIRRVKILPTVEYLNLQLLELARDINPNELPPDPPVPVRHAVAPHGSSRRGHARDIDRDELHPGPPVPVRHAVAPHGSSRRGHAAAEPDSRHPRATALPRNYHEGGGDGQRPTRREKLGRPHGQDKPPVTTAQRPIIISSDDSVQAAHRPTISRQDRHARNAASQQNRARRRQTSESADEDDAPKIDYNPTSPDYDGPPLPPAAASNPIDYAPTSPQYPTARRMGLPPAAPSTHSSQQFGQSHLPPPSSESSHTPPGSPAEVLYDQHGRLQYPKPPGKPLPSPAGTMSLNQSDDEETHE